ncbi:hypothetical protein [Streptomyces sp. C10-9-1]|uniref:hypothetical protein n=1 Tax=Streptomyces sp. C10-9-1 TaxID=1859285 RepID=UPI003F4A0F48
MARSSYTPPEDAAKLFSRQKQLVDAQAEIKDPLRDMAVREMRSNGASVGDLARLTGLSTEFFRRIARAEGVERRREPTVGPIKSDD